MFDRSKASAPPLNSLRADDVRRACPMVRVDVILPGDVLLTRSAGLPAKGIAAAAHGRFSHAAIFLPIYDDEGVPFAPPLLLVEADRHGVGPSFPGFAWISSDGVPTARLPYYRLPAGTADAMVLRHPGMGAVSGETLSSVVHDLDDGEFWKAYSRLARLKHATDLNPTLRELAGLALGLIDTGDPSLIAGTFCSELVAKFFEKIGLALFDGGRAPERIWPSLLVPQFSALRQVPYAVLEAKHVKEEASGHLAEAVSPVLSRPTLLPLLVADRSRVARLETGATELAGLVQNDLVETLRGLGGLAEALLDENALALKRMAAIGDRGVSRRLERVGARLRTASAMVDLVRNELSGTSGGGSADTVPARGLACYVASSIMAAAAHDGRRTTMLATARLLRRSEQDLGPFSRMRIRSGRRRLVRSWKAIAHGRTTVEALRLMRPRDKALADVADALIVTAARSPVE